MKVIEIQERFGLDRLALAEREDPVPGPGQARLEMRAASLNYRDLLTVAGKYNPKQPLPMIPCSDGVGVVTRCGPGVTRVRVGDRVAPIFAQRWLAGAPTRERMRSTLGGPLDGTLAEAMVVDEEGLVHVPGHLTDEEAATLPCAGVTAWNALVRHGGVRAGDTVLTLGTGGVSLFALQLARTLGARVIVTSGSDEKLERATALGAWKTINYREDPRWDRTVKELTGGEGVDVVIEVGGGGTLARSLAAVRFGGTICQIGNLAGGKTEVDLIPLFMRQLRLQGVLVGDRESFEALTRALAVAELRPVVDRVFPLERTREALEWMAAGRHFGKICIRIGD